MSAFNVMLAKNYDPKRISDWSRIYVEPKHDGVRVIVMVEGQDVQYFSRNGRELDMFSHLDDAMRDIAYPLRKLWRDAIVIDGEMMGDDRGDMLGAIHRKNATVHGAAFHPFLAIPSVAFYDGIDWKPQHERLGDMVKCDVTVPASFPAKNDARVHELYSVMLSKGHEGAMVKDYNAKWEAKRTYAWMKMKSLHTADLKIVAFKEGTGKYEGTLGAVVVRYKKALVPVSGMDDATRDAMWEDQKYYLGRTLEVAYQRETENGSLYHPRYVRLRTDK